MKKKSIAIRKAELAKVHSESADFRIKQIIQLDTGLKPGDKAYDAAVELMRDAQIFTQKIQQFILLLKNE